MKKMMTVAGLALAVAGCCTTCEEPACAKPACCAEKKACCAEKKACCAAQSWRELAEKPMIVSHRGGRGEYDDNAAGGFAKCLAAGIRGYETDVRMTKDDGLVIMHDGDVSRTTTGAGKVAEMTLAEVTALKLKRSGENVPCIQTLANVFKGATGIRVEWEMKENLKSLGSQERLDKYCRGVHDTVVKTMEPGTYVFISFYADTLETMKRLYPDAPISLNSGKPASKALVDKAVALGCCGVAPVLKGTKKEFVDYAHSKGLVVSLWMVQNEQDYARARSLGADTNTSDNPLALLKAERAAKGK